MIAKSTEAPALDVALKTLWGASRWPGMADGVTDHFQSQGQVGRDRRFADAALAGGDGHNVLDAG